MSLIDKILYEFSDESKLCPYFKDLDSYIKDHIDTILNSRLGNYGRLNDSIIDLWSMGVEINELGHKLGMAIYELISSNENRIEVTSIGYDDSLKPWRIIFNINYKHKNDNFKEYLLKVIFKNNRYCEIL